mmetsp:Transcript_41522/g.81901  ORF Transcript_41522/g.81901 Transcript_41522/m.81901 type:complete len:123 (+) Transcript_41522:632-1000(+)
MGVSVFSFLASFLPSFLCLCICLERQGRVTARRKKQRTIPKETKGNAKETPRKYKTASGVLNEADQKINSKALLQEKLSSLCAKLFCFCFCKRLHGHTGPSYCAVNLKTDSQHVPHTSKSHR